MIRIAHISDLHFGRESPELVRALTAELEAERPDLVAVSGDLTQNARNSEFVSARTFLDSLPSPLLVVPGNHDLPNAPLMRIAAPWSRWRRHIATSMEPVVYGNDYCAVGINSARRWGPYLDWSRGRISQAQIARAECLFHESGKALRLIVAHHPFLLTEAGEGRNSIARGAIALPRFLKAGVDLVLGGHVHLAYSGVLAGVVVAQTGTSLSNRLKGEPNSFNRIRASDGAIEVDTMVWQHGRFAPLSTSRYLKSEGIWRSACGERDIRQ